MVEILKLKFGKIFEAEVWSRFRGWILINLCYDLKAHTLVRALNFLEMVLFSLYLHFFIAHNPGSKAMHTKVIIQKSEAMTNNHQSSSIFSTLTILVIHPPTEKRDCLPSPRAGEGWCTGESSKMSSSTFWNLKKKHSKWLKEEIPYCFCYCCCFVTKKMNVLLFSFSP